MKNYNAIIDVHDQATNADIKTYEDIRKLKTGQSEDVPHGICWIIIT